MAMHTKFKDMEQGWLGSALTLVGIHSHAEHGSEEVSCLHIAPPIAGKTGSYRVCAKFWHCHFVGASLAGDNTLNETTTLRVNHQELVISNV